jgi:hypothetical protein
VLAGAAGKKAQELQQIFVSHLLNLLEYYHFPDEALELFDQLAVLFGKTESKKVIASVTGIRHSYNCQYDYAQVPQIVAEHRVNSSPMCGSDYFYPFEKFLAFRNLFEDREKRSLEFTLPSDLRCCAHRNLHDSFSFPLYCFSDEAETARVPVEDLMRLHQGGLEILELKQAKPEDIFQLNRLAGLLMETIEGFLSKN